MRVTAAIVSLAILGVCTSLPGDDKPVVSYVKAAAPEQTASCIMKALAAIRDDFTPIMVTTDPQQEWEILQRSNTTYGYRVRLRKVPDGTQVDLIYSSINVSAPLAKEPVSSCK